MEAFLRVSKEFCDFVENSVAEHQKGDYYKRLLQLLSQLAAQSITLLDIYPDAVKQSKRDDKKFDAVRVSDEERHQIACQLQAVIMADLYAAKAELEQSERAEEGWRVWMLWDDLQDLYADLRSEQRVWELGTELSQVEAAWDLRFGYGIHWGCNLMDALRSVHLLHFELVRP